MRYLGMDVHMGSSVWCLLNDRGEETGRGKVATTADSIRGLVESLSGEDELLVGQEVGTMSHYVHDAVNAAGVRILSFNAQHLRMISSSRKKTDRRDAYWIAKTLQTGMMPHPVYIPREKERQLRRLLSTRDGVMRERQRWMVRAGSYLKGAGLHGGPGARVGKALVQEVIEDLEDREPDLVAALQLCQRQESLLSQELAVIDAKLRQETRGIDDIRRLMTIPGVGLLVGTAIYAWVGDVTRFRNAKTLAAYAGLVTSVWQTGETLKSGHITKQGSPALRRMLVQAAQVLISRCRTPEAWPLQAIAMRVQDSRHRRKIAVVALARHILRVSYYVLRDGTVYDPALLHSVQQEDNTGETAA